jgi:AcrR family transcriptional regulator
MLDNAADTRSAAIISAALTTFMNYGFKRTTMDDIARAAGMSRPALYLAYKNKKDIFRACVIAMTDELREDLASLLAMPGTTEERILQILNLGIVKPHREIGTTPHGDELFALKSEIAADLFKGWMDVIEEALTRQLEEDARKGLIDCSTSGTGIQASDIAALIAESAEGIKMRMPSPDMLPGKLQMLVRLIVGPLAVPK